ACPSPPRGRTARTARGFVSIPVGRGGPRTRASSVATFRPRRSMGGGGASFPVSSSPSLLLIPPGGPQPMLVLKLLRTWLQRRNQRRLRAAGRTRRPLVVPFRPQLLTLEDRLVPGNLLNLTGFLPGSVLGDAATVDRSSSDQSTSSNAVYNT